MTHYGIPGMNDTLNKLHAQVQMLEKLLFVTLEMLQRDLKSEDYHQYKKVYEHAVKEAYKALEKQSYEFDTRGEK